MKIRLAYFTLLAAIFVLITAVEPANAQKPVEISNEKVSIAGKQYYIHIVKKGQTLYSIARAYNISTGDILKENRLAVYGLSEGDPLKIPVTESADTKPGQPQSDNKDYISHTLRRGETIFALSKMYNVPEESIRESNPGVDIFDLPVGSVLSIPRKEFREEPRAFITDSEGYRLHRIEKGQSLSDIARLYDIPVKEIRSANRRTIFPRVGDYIRIPVNETVALIEEPLPDYSAIDDSLLLEDDNITRLFDGSSMEYTSINELSGSVNISLMLPLYLKENSLRTYIDSSDFDERGEKIYKTLKREQEWIYPRSVNFIEYYEGVILAVQNLMSKGLDIDLRVYDTAADSLIVDSLLYEGSLRDADLIIGPVYSYNVSKVADYARRYRIPVVSPLASRNSGMLDTSPYLFKVQPSMEVIEERMAEVICDYYDYNLVYVYADTAWSEDVTYGLKNRIFRKMRYVTPLDEINFREVFFTSRSAYNDTINIIEHALKKDMPNLVILASDDEAVMSEVVGNIHTLLRNYDIELIGYPRMRWLDERLDPLYLFHLGAMMLTPGWVDYQQDDVKHFITKYRAMFNMEPPLRSYAWQSYDISTYFISGIALHGKRFIYQPLRHRPDLLQTDYSFERTGLAHGFENKRLFLIKYTPELEIVFPETGNFFNHGE